MSVVRKIEFRNDPLDGTPTVMDLEFGAPRLSVALMPPLTLFPEDPRKETRGDFAMRLRRAAADFGRHVEREVVSQLKRMGHLVD